MTRMTRPDCAVMCNLFNKYTHTLYDTMIIIRIQSTTTVLVHTVPRNNTTTRILNASRPSEHFPVRGGNFKTFRWDHRLQIQNLFMSFKWVPRW